MHYFIEPDDVRPEVDIYGPRHVALATAVMGRLRTDASLIFRDRFGWSLYKVSGRYFGQ